MKTSIILIIFMVMHDIASGMICSQGNTVLMVINVHKEYRFHGYELFTRNTIFMVINVHVEYRFHGY